MSEFEKSEKMEKEKIGKETALVSPFGCRTGKNTYLRMLVFALFMLAAVGFLSSCGTSGKSKTPAAETGEPAEEETTQMGDTEADLQAEIDKLKEEISDLQAEIDRLEEEQMDAEEAAMDAEEAAMDAEAAANAMALHKALDVGPNPTLTIVADSSSLSLARDIVTTVTPNIAAIAVNLKAGDSTGALGEWTGTHYSVTDAGTKVTDAAVVYSNAAAPTKNLFSKEYETDSDYASATRTLTLGTDADPLIKSDKFPTAGLQSYPVPARSDGVYIQGTYDGALGEYKCTGTCIAAFGNTGISLTGTWTFKHASGAMVSRPDDNYLYFGWWLRTNDGTPSEANAFSGAKGLVVENQPDVTGFQGTATYTGKAAGKFAINDLLQGSDAGHFTADATLTAKFGDATDAGISGKISSFMANDNAVPWSVTLNRAGWVGSNGAFSSGENPATVWSIDGKSAPTSGNWEGQMYDEKPEPAGDGSNVPTSVVGVFESQFGSTHSMAGGFGATKQ